MAAGGIVPAAPAHAVLDHPPRVDRTFDVQSVSGTCHLGGTTEAKPSPAGVGAVTTVGWTDCSALSATPRIETIRSEITGLGATPASGGTRGEHFCEFVKYCSMIHSRRLLLPGDYFAAHRLSVDLTQGGTSNTYWLSYPPGCSLSNSDTGSLICVFEQVVTYLPARVP